MTQRINVAGLQELARELAKRDRNLQRELVQACRRTAEHGRTQAIRHAAAEGLRPRPGGAGKDYASSFGVTPTSDGAVMGNSAPHARFVERGRRAGRPPPVTVILLWMFERGMIKRIPGFKQKVHVDKSIKGRTRRMVAGVVVALLAAGLFVGVDAHITDGSLGRWWRIGLVPLIFFSALCVFQAQERT